MDDGRNESQLSLDKRLFELTSLFEISRTFSASLNLHTILENVLRIPMGQMLINKGIILLKQDSHSYCVEELKGLQRQMINQTFRIVDPPAFPRFVREIQSSEPWAVFFKKLAIELILPVISSQDHIGLIGFGPKISGEEFTEDDIEFLDTLSNMAATSIANGQMVEEIQKINRHLDRKVQQLNTIFDISRELNITLDARKIGSLLGFAVMGELLVNKYMIYLRNGNPALLSSKGISDKPDVSAALFELNGPLLLEDTDRFEIFRELGLSILVPMCLQEQTRGALLVGPKISGGSFDETELDFLQTLGNQAITAIENARLFKETLEKQRMEEELNLARQIQQNLLPTSIPEIPGYDLAAMNIPSREVGGDYFDILPISDGKWVITIGDVSGKGAGAALLMASLQASIHALAQDDLPLNLLLSRINMLFYNSTDLDKYITFFYGILDTEKQNFTYCNAGHNYPVLLRETGEIEHLSTGGIVIGMMPEMPYQIACVDLHPEDLLCFYTDGVTEAMNQAEEEFGEERLESYLKSNYNLKSHVVMDGLIAAIGDFSNNAGHADDVTLVILKRLHPD